MPHLDCVPVPVPAVHPKGPSEFVEIGFEPTKTAQKQQQQQIKEEHPPKSNIANEKVQKRKMTKGMCHPITEESLTQFQLDKLAELRNQLGHQLLQDTPIFNDNFSLLRWLHGWNYRIDEIVPRFKKASSVFRCMRVNERIIEDVDELNDYARTLTDAADYFPGGILGYDREGNVVVMQRMGQSHPKQLSKCGRVSDVYRLSIVETALLYQLIRLQERKRRRKLGLRVIIDLEGFNTDHLTTFGLKVYGALLKSMQDTFPDLLRQVYVINAHYLVKTAYTIIKPVLSEQSREKVVFLDSAFQEQLAQDIGKENLFPKWGGTRQPTRGHPEFGTLRTGGIPPTNLRYSPSTHPYMPESQLKKFSVPARQRREIEMHIPSGHFMLHWFWTSSSDIDFGLMMIIGDEEEDNEGNGTEKEIWPMFRLLTDFVPEFGCAKVEPGQKYKFVFDNSFSVFTRKEVKFGHKLVEIEDEKKITTKIDEEKKLELQNENEKELMKEEKENEILEQIEGKFISNNAVN